MSRGEAYSGTGRIEAFSDGVIAIVATIMVLELQMPAQTFMTGDFMTVFLELGPDLSVYALSFLLVSILLINHQTLIRSAPHATTALYWWNANFLFWMALIPLSTSVYGKHPLTPLAAAFYGVVLFANMVGLGLLRRSIVRINATVAGADPNVDAALFRKDMIFSTAYALSVPLAYVSVYASMAIFVIVPAAYFLPDFAPGRR
jgi:uncharacterized membrane protein